MAIIAKSSGEGQSFTPAPTGVHQAVCVDVVDLGVLDVSWQGQTKRQHKVNLAWQLNEDRDDGKPYLIFKRYTLSLHEKAALRKDLESWRGRKFTREEEMGFDIETVIGANCLLNVTHNQVGDRTYANVSSVNPLMKGMPVLKARDFVRKFERDATATAEAHANGSAVAMAAAYAAAAKQAEEYEAQAPPITDDDIPFAWLLPLIMPALATMGAVLA